MFKFRYWIFALASHSLHAVTILNVTVSTDNNPGGTGDTGDLRYCLNLMNQGLNSTPDDYEIIFDFPMTIQLNGILPIINNSSNPVNITIGNSGSIPTVTIDGNGGAYSGFFTPMGNVTIQNMTFQNLTAKGGNGGDGTAGGGGGMGAGGAIYVPQSFLNGSNPSITLKNVSINYCSAVGGNGGSYLSGTPSGDEGGGGGGGFSGNGGSITTSGTTGGAGGGGFGGDGGNVTSSTGDVNGGGGGGGGGLGSRATIGTPSNLGNGGSDQDNGQDGNGYHLTITAGSGGGGNSGGSNAGGGGGGGGTPAGGGGGGSSGTNGTQPQGNIPPGAGVIPSGGNGGDGGGGGGGGIVTTSVTNEVDGKAGSGGYGGGGGGGAGTGASDTAYTVQGGSGGVGGGGGGGGANQSDTTSADGGHSLGGGGGGGGGPSNGSTATGGSDTGNLGGGAGGTGSNTFGAGFGGGGGGGGSGLGGAIFVDSNLNLTIQAISGIPTAFNTSNNTTQAGTHGTGGPGGSDGFDGSALGNSIFLRAGSSLTFIANDANDLLTLGDQVAFIDDTSFGAGGTSVFVRGNGTVIYNGTTDYQGTVTINNANFKVNGQIDQAPIFVCRNIGFSAQRGTLSGVGTLSGAVYANSGTISPDTGGTLTLGSLVLNPADPGNNTLGSLVHIEIDSSSTTSKVAVTGHATLAGTLELDIDPNAQPGTYNILTSSGITGTFDSVSFTGSTPNYSLSYLPVGTPTFVQFDFLGFSHPISTTGLSGNDLSIANYLNSNASTSVLDLFNGLSGAALSDALNSVSPARNAFINYIATQTSFSASQVVNGHMDQLRFGQMKPTRAPFTALLVADAKEFPSLPVPERNAWESWITGFAEYAHLDASLQNPAFHYLSEGVLVGLDYSGKDRRLIGGSLGYAHTHFNYAGNKGHGHTNAFIGSLYGNAWVGNVYLSPAIWGIFGKSNQTRPIAFSSFSETAKASIQTWQLIPHIELGYVKELSWGNIIPFASVDWAVSWQDGYTEHGASPFNTNQQATSNSMLRSEGGLKFWEKWCCVWGDFSMQEKFSYVFEKPFGVGTVNAAFVGTPGSFIVAAANQTLSLGTVGLDFLFSLGKKKSFDIKLGYEGEFGASFYSNEGMFTLTKRF